MVDLEQFWSVGGLAVLVSLLVQVGKQQPLRDLEKGWLPYVAMGTGVILAASIGWTLGRIITPADWLSAGLGGVLAGLSATGFYEATTDKLKKWL